MDGYIYGQKYLYKEPNVVQWRNKQLKLREYCGDNHVAREMSNSVDFRETDLDLMK